MFGALNRFISRLDTDPQAQRPTNSSSYGFQVLRNTNNELPLEPWFDFIIGINGRSLDNPDGGLFATEVRNCAGSSVELGVWSAKGQRIRSFWVAVPTGSTSLGISLQWQPLASTDDVWHILDVTANSPADQAGLLPYGDYIIGSPEAIMKGEHGLGELVEEFIGQEMRLYVYNHEYDVTRLVTITPSRTWGGTGALGCILGFGALHKIPAILDEPPQAPGETLFETARLSMDTSRPASGLAMRDNYSQGRSSLDQLHILVPADIPAAPPTSFAPPMSSKPPQQVPASRRNKPARHNAATIDMDDYFREGEAKSREHDHTPSANAKPGEHSRPPPKAGESFIVESPPPTSTNGLHDVTSVAATADPDSKGHGADHNAMQAQADDGVAEPIQNGG